MRVSTFDKPADLESVAGAWLAKSPKRNNLVLSILRRTIQLSEQARCWLVSSPHGPELAIIQPPQHEPCLSDGTLEAAQAAARFLPGDLPGIIGPSEVADAFCTEWCTVYSSRAHMHWENTFYTLDRVEPFAIPGGEFRRATEADLDQLVPLAIAAAKAMNLPPQEQRPEEVEKRVRRNIAGRRQFVWIEGSAIRAIASYAETLSDAGARIGLVYTPAELRGRGYGTAIVGSLARLLLSEGQAWVSLFADNTNPTSNRIYRRLGFRAELPYRTWIFEP